ncbi:MAG TPA: cytochrome c biogenesis protein CcsA [Thermoanaerobaculia bacterium]|nr:cytochrome c biogenesis protein CcsA [Thermoanaerobaculia bacterium]
MRPLTWQHGLGILGFSLLIVGSTMGLTQAPPERHMGEVSRILYVHVPTAWSMLLASTFAFGWAIASLWTGRERYDALLAAAVEVTVVLATLMLATGSLFARPTWGVWWDWDVRLTTSLLGLVLFAGILGLRAFVDEPSRRATWTAVATIVAYVDIPLIYFGVRWWRSIHQVQSSPETVSSGMVLPWRINAFAVLFIALWLIALRSRIETGRRLLDQTGEPEPIAEATA